MFFRTVFYSKARSIAAAYPNYGVEVLKSKQFAPKPNTRIYHEAATTADVHLTKGVNYLRDPRLNKGLAFTLEERIALGIHGLLPAQIKTQEEQMEKLIITLDSFENPLNKYMFLVELLARNERLYYRLITENIVSLMPIVYTPTVGLACQKYGLVFQRARGLFITIHDRGHVYDILRNWPVSDVRGVCVTDGERILGLGDLGAFGMGISTGKLALYTALAGVPPHMLLPVVIDVGCNNETLIQDPLYVGLRHKRVPREDYDELMDEFMEAVVRCYGQNTLIQFEDFGIGNAFRLLDKYRNCYCTFNDDIQGTGSVVLAGLLAAERVTGKKLEDEIIVFAGAGSAGTGIAQLILTHFRSKNIPKKEAASKIWLSDVNGLIVSSRKELSPSQQLFAKDHEQLKSLEEIVEKLKPTVLIGVTAVGGLFTEKILRTMAANTERPIIFPLSNPTSQAECTAEDAYKFTDSRVVFSSGSPFPAVTINGKTYTCGQGNNAYIFPGVALAVIATGTHHIPEEMFLIAAITLAENVSDAHLEKGTLYPPIDQIRNISIKISAAVAQYAFDKGLATEYPEPECKEEWLKSLRYNYCYGSALRTTWKWPEIAGTKVKDKMKSK